MKKFLPMLLLPVVVIGMLIASPPPSPVGAQIDPTLEAAQRIIWQATARAQATRNAQEAMLAAQRATAAAMSIQQTQTAAEATRSYQATRQALDSQATRQALDLQATAEKQHQEATATQAALAADATRTAATATAVMAGVQAEATQQAIARQAQAESRTETLRLIGIIVLFAIGVALAVAATRALWRIGPRKIPPPIVVVESAVGQSGPPPGPGELPAIPPTRVVYDAEAVRKMGEILAYQSQPEGESR